ncbi:MAG: oligopeptide/dipeptide ABC transporter ATP-binding protein, partial [Micromonosporaceae bacterium]
LQDAVPVADPAVEAGRHPTPLRGEVPDPASPPPGCPFHPRCPIAVARCATDVPPLVEHRAGQFAACHLAGEPVAPDRA